jgi:dienelactone hydrolase
VLIIACTGSPAQVAKAPQVVAEFDPSLPEPKLPLPNLLAIDPDTLLLDVADPVDANDAEKAVGAWLRTLNGFPVSSVATVSFSGALDTSTVSSTTVQLFDVTEGHAVALTPKQVSYDTDKKQLRLEHIWAAARTYAIAVLGGPTGLKGAGGELVVGSDAFDLLRAKYPMVTCSDLTDPMCRSANPGIRGTSIDDERKRAVKMERARLKAAVVIDALEAGGFPRENLATVWSFSTEGLAQSSPVATLEPAVRAIPFPCDALLENGKVQLPEEPGDDVLVTRTKADLARLDGFSVTASIVTEHEMTLGAAGGGLLPGTLLPAHLQLLDLDAAGATVSATLRTRTDPDQVLLHPDVPLRSHRHYAVVWTRGAKALDGRDLMPAPAFAMLSAGHAFVDAAGRSTVRALEDAAAGGLERLRQSVSAGLAAAEAKGIARSEVLLAWTFTTQTTTPTLTELQGKPAQWGLPTSVSQVAALPQASQLSAITSLFGKDFSSAVRSGLEGVFVTGNALDLQGSELDLSLSPPGEGAIEGPFTESTLATPHQEQLKFMLVLPKVPKYADGRIPIIIFQHGITRFRRDALLIANSIAKKGYATLAIDHPLHGDRSFCTTAADCVAGATCTAHRCPLGGYRVASGIDAQLGTPAVSGLKFSSTTNIAATRDQIRQLVIDTAQLIRVVKDTTQGIGSLDVDDPATASLTERLEPAELGYIGMSLGSVMGALAVAANPELTRATLNVGGASPADILSQATVPFLAEKKRALDQYLLTSRGIAPGTQAYEDFYDIARWLLDPADAQSFGKSYIDEPLPSAPKKRIFVSWVANDPWVPNATTQLLINSIEHVTAPSNFGEHQWSDNGNHSFMMDPSSPIVLMAQDEAVGWIDAP